MILAETGIQLEIGHVLAGLSVLGGIIGLFWKIIYGNHKETKIATQDLQVKLDENNEKFIVIAEDMGEMKGKLGMAEAITPKLDAIHAGLQDLSGQVLRKLQEDGDD